MLEIRTLIKCDKCGSTKVKDEEIIEIKEKIVTMDEWIKTHNNRGGVSSETVTFGVSHGEKRQLVCKECGYFKKYTCVVYAYA